MAESKEEQTMTAKGLIKALEQIVAKHGNIPVAVDWETFDASNGVYTIERLGSVQAEWVRLVDGDGFGLFTQKGTERGNMRAVLRYDDKPPVGR
jgi:hypothetical protein